MKKIYIRIVSTGKVFSYEAPLKLKPNQSVLVETDQIIEEGKVVAETEADPGTGRIIRTIETSDRRACCQLKGLARQYLDEARQKTVRNGLNMSILDADLSFDQKKLTFYFSATSRVDFRGLVLDMARSFGKLIRLQQVGSREEAKYFGGIGKCGRELCCSKFLESPEEITFETAKTLGPRGGVGAKSLGSCGKLMCCLAFEGGNCPKIEKTERTK